MLITLGSPLTEAAVYLLSEPLFIFLELLFFLWFARFLETGRTKYALLFTLAAALHALTRYPGVILIFTGCLALLLFPADGFRKRLLRSFLFGFFSSIPLAMWLGRNYILTGLFAGVRTPAYLTLSENLQLTGQTIASWFFPASWNPIAALIFLALLAISYTIHFLKQKQNFVQLSNQPLFVLLSIYTLAYTVYMNVTLSVYHNAQLGNRLLSPIFIPLLLALGYLFIRIRHGFSIVMSSSWQKNWLGLILLITLLISPIDAQYKLVQREVVTFSTGFSMYSLRNSETIAYLQKNPLPDGQMIYSNCHRCLYVFANIQPALPYDSKVRDMYLTPANLPFYIVWFNEVLPEGGTFGEHYPMPDPGELLGMPVKVKEYASFSDGTIYLVTP
ncbi:MAG: hypothetical protein WHV66_04370 [Anaerolineales bacterium]